MKSLNKDIKNERSGNRHPLARKASLPINVAVRSMTDEEARLFQAAIDLLLADMVCQHLGRRGEKT